MKQTLSFYMAILHTRLQLQLGVDCRLRAKVGQAAARGWKILPTWGL